MQGREDLTLNEYQEGARLTAVYPDEFKIIYPALGLAGETGETVEKIKKAVRKGGTAFQREIDYAGVVREMGDVLWYLANLASDIGVPLEAVAMVNLEKLAMRAEKKNIIGEGDNR
jgi:NTP pyrophosphatase (non-canonical NTP hydrolase)